MEKKIMFQDASVKEIIGTSFYKGCIKASAKEISKVLGNPFLGEDKTTYEWQKKVDSLVFTVYDYKEEVRPNQNTVVEYHIGTKSDEETYFMVYFFKGLGLNAYFIK